MKIVFVHGRAQQAKDPRALLSTWSTALLKGLTQSGSSLATPPELLLPYYGDELFAETERVARERFQTLVDKGADAAAPGAEEQQFFNDLVLGIAAQHGISPQAISAQANGDALDKGIANWRGVLAALRLLDEIPGVSASFIEQFTRDVWCYLTSSGARKAVHNIVAAAIPEEEPCVVVAHSLGSIVAYNILMDRRSRSNICKLVTLGSPLGIEAVYSRLPSDTSPRKAPVGVAAWFNARDARDVVSLHEIPSTKFRGEPVVENYSGVQNQSENRHGVHEYLLDPTVAAAVRSTLG